MNTTIANRKLARQYANGTLARHYPVAVAEAFADVIELMLAVQNERELYAFKGLRPEKLQGRPESSIRLNGQFRLIYTIGALDGAPTIFVEGIEDYH